MPSVQFRIEVDNMRHQIVQAIMVHQVDLEAELTRLVSETIDNYDFEAVVATMTSDIMKQAIRTAIERDIKSASEGAWEEMRDLVMSKMLKKEIAGDG